jgi:hypothetical protein
VFSLSPAGAGARIIDGKAIAEAVRAEVAEKVAAMKAATGKARYAQPRARRASFTSGASRRLR